MSSTRSRPSTSVLFPQQMNVFLPSAWSNYKASTDLTTWARTEARRFHHDVNSTVPFVPVYSALLSFAEKQKKPDSQLKKSSHIVSEPFQLSSAESLGRAQLNAVLFREHTRWWDAFVAEAEEDPYDSATASDRFSFHCAKILNKSTGLSINHLSTVVTAWLLEKTDA